MSTTTTTPSVRDGSPLSHEELAAWRGFLRVHAALTRALDAELAAEHGLPLSSYGVLLFLNEAPNGRMRMSELADSALISRSGLTRLVDRLERAGLVMREGCETDARGLNTVLTPAGRRAFDAARTTHLAGVRERFLDRLDDGERAALAGMWERMAPGATAAGGPACG